MTRYRHKNALWYSILLISVVNFPDIAGAFEMETHALITHHAISQSVLGKKIDSGELDPNTEQLLSNLGLWKGLIPQPDGVEGDCVSLADKHPTLGKIYFDGPRRSKIYCRSVTIFDDVKRLSTPWPGSIENWITMGAIREDDNRQEIPPYANDDPNQVEKDGSCPILDLGLIDDLDCRQQRVFNHFFDPYNDIPLSFDAERNFELIGKVVPHGRPSTIFPSGLIQLGWRSHVWGIPRRWLSPEWRMTGGRPAPPDQPDSWTSGNQYTLWDMHEALFRGLTGHTFLDGELKSVAPTQRQRNRWFATSFRALGDILHLNQDMGQPQHTRNDPHAGKFYAGHRSVFEAYVNARALNNVKELEPVTTDLPCIMPPLQPLLFYESPYKEPPRFSQYLYYWTTSLGRQNVGKVGKGLADYTNRGFFTHGTNLGDTDYPRPINDIGEYKIKPRGILSGPDCERAITTETLEGEVRDGLSGESDFMPLTERRSLFPGFTLGRLVYDSMADHVVPRAVAYSTGLINHIFRGRLDVALPPEGVYAITDHSHSKGFERIKAVITNTTKDIPTSDGGPDAQHLSGGVLIGIVRFHRNTCYSKDLRGEYSLLKNSEKFADCRKRTPEPPELPEEDDLQQEIVVSKPKKGFSLQTNTPETVELDFSETPIPFSATDIYLQLVYHGRLGIEAAVVIGGKDLSEPTYIGVINALDYTSVKGVVYSRNDLMTNKDNVLNQIRQVRGNCVQETTPGSLQLIETCFQPRELNLSLTIGTGNVPNLEVDGLPVNRFFRFAVLGDAAGGEVQLKRSKGNCTVLEEVIVNYPVAKNQWESQLRSKYVKQEMQEKRKVMATYVGMCLLKGDPENEIYQISQPPTKPLGLPDSENYVPFPVTVKF